MSLSNSFSAPLYPEAVGLGGEGGDAPARDAGGYFQKKAMLCLCGGSLGVDKSLVYRCEVVPELRLLSAEYILWLKPGKCLVQLQGCHHPLPGFWRNRRHPQVHPALHMVPSFPWESQPPCAESPPHAGKPAPGSTAGLHPALLGCFTVRAISEPFLALRQDEGSLEELALRILQAVSFRLCFLPLNFGVLERSLSKGMRLSGEGGWPGQDSQATLGISA